MVFKCNPSLNVQSDWHFHKQQCPRGPSASCPIPPLASFWSLAHYSPILGPPQLTSLLPVRDSSIRLKWGNQCMVHLIIWGLYGFAVISSLRETRQRSTLKSMHWRYHITCTSDPGVLFVFQLTATTPGQVKMEGKAMVLLVMREFLHLLRKFWDVFLLC